MALTLVELQRPANERLWQPFSLEESDGFRREWWCDLVRQGDRSVFLQALEGEVEIARVRLIPPIEPPGMFLGVGNLGPWVHEIQSFEVRADLTRKGDGEKVIALLHQLYPQHRFIARSHGADGFWGGRLNWSRHLHPDSVKQQYGDPLYVGPPRAR